MPEDVRGIVTLKVEDYVTTDHIMPAGSRLKYRSNVPKYSEFVFEPLDKDFVREHLSSGTKEYITSWWQA